jgi:hypothetical protein
MCNFPNTILVLYTLSATGAKDASEDKLYTSGKRP